MTEVATDVAESPELTTFKRKVWSTAQRMMAEYGDRQHIQEILDNVGLGADIFGEALTEPEAEGLYRVAGASTDLLVIKAKSPDYSPERCWFVTLASTPRATGYDPVPFSQVISDLYSRGLLAEENGYKLELVKA